MLRLEQLLEATCLAHFITLNSNCNSEMPTGWPFFSSYSHQPSPLASDKSTSSNVVPPTAVTLQGPTGYHLPGSIPLHSKTAMGDIDEPLYSPNVSPFKSFSTTFLVWVKTLI